MQKKYILAIDQGTSSTKTILFDELGQPFARGTVPLKTHYLNNGFVEQDPEDIYNNVLQSVQQCLKEFISKGGVLTDIKTAGISNQRETFVLWNKNGQPLYRAVVWQCKRSLAICEAWKKAGYQERVHAKTGLLIDPYFSGSKLAWLYQHNESVKTAVDEGNAFFGTVDTWLLYKLTAGKSYYTDYTNASRTLLFNLHSLQWDEELLETFQLSKLRLPELKPSSADFGSTNFDGLLPGKITITGMIGDSHAAAFGEGCFTPGSAKATMGTGCSILMNIGAAPVDSKNGMVTTICWSTEDIVNYALEGVIVTCGATIEWLKNELGLFTDSSNTEAMANAVPDNGGVFLIPAFSGLGAPYWDMNRKASIVGLGFGTNKNHITRAALESIAFQVMDVVKAMQADTNIPLQQLMADGGITSNRFVMQLLADLLKTPVVNIGHADVSALGAAYMAGLKSGIYTSIEQLKEFNTKQTVIQPGIHKPALQHYNTWAAVIAGNQY